MIGGRGGGKVPPGVIDFSQLGKDQIVKDSFGRELGVGDVVMAPQAGGTYRVTLITPAVGPGIPPNLMRVDLVSVVSMGVPRGASIEGVMRVLTNAEAVERGAQAGAQPTTGDGAEPPKEGPGPESEETSDHAVEDPGPTGFPPSPIDPRD